MRLCVGIGNLAPLRRRRKECGSTGGREISDDLYGGYLVDGEGKIIGEARGYDPYSKFGHIMLYEIDSFGFVPGFISSRIKLMSEEDLEADPRLRKELEKTKYEIWKRQNISELQQKYEKAADTSKCFESFCKDIYNSD